MHQTSELYQKIVADRFHKVECKLVIDGVEYGENTLVSVETENNLFAEEAPSCGNAVSGTITAKLRTPNTVIRTKAKMELFARVTSGDLSSEWIPKGVYFLDAREKQKAKNGEDTIIVLDGFDAILMGEQEYIPSGDWPKSDAEVIEEMCWILGVECTWIPDKNFPIQKPIGYSVREIIGYVAAMYGGSVTMDDSGKLKFVGLRKNQDGHEVVFSGLSVGDKLAPITKVILHKMDGNKFTAGDDSGRTLNVDSPWATQEVADYILESVALHEYQPFTATGVIVDPAVEIGDVLKFGGTGKCCYQQDTVYGKAMISTMGAMEEKEINHDYKYISSDSRSTSRALSGYGSALSKLEKKQEELSDSFEVGLGDVRSSLDVYVKKTEDLEEASAALTTRVSGAEASINLNAKNIDGVASSVATIQADVVELKGRVNLTDTAYVTEDHGLGVKGSIVANGNILGNGYIGTADANGYVLNGAQSYKPTEITSTTGTVLVLGIA